MYLRSYKTGSGLKLRLHNELPKKTAKKTSIVLPNRALANIELTKYAKIMEIPNFRGVYMKNSLPISGPRTDESAIINCDDKIGRCDGYEVPTIYAFVRKEAYLQATL